MITSFCIKNYRGLSLDLDLHKGFQKTIAVNGASGKTTLLEALIVGMGHFPLLDRVLSGHVNREHPCQRDTLISIEIADGLCFKREGHEFSILSASGERISATASNVASAFPGVTYLSAWRTPTLRNHARRSLLNATPEEWEAMNDMWHTVTSGTNLFRTSIGALRSVSPETGLYAFDLYVMDGQGHAILRFDELGAGFLDAIHIAMSIVFDQTKTLLIDRPDLHLWCPSRLMDWVCARVDQTFMAGSPMAEIPSRLCWTEVR